MRTRRVHGVIEALITDKNARQVLTVRRRSSKGLNLMHNYTPPAPIAGNAQRPFIIPSCLECGFFDTYEAANSCIQWIGSGSPVDWLSFMRDELTAKGYRCIPHGAEQPLAKFADGQTYKANDPLWQQALLISVALPPDVILIDLDGYKENATTVAEIANALGITEAQLDEAKVQERTETRSIHWLFQVPHGHRIKAATSEWLPSVDIKVGNNNGLVNVKPYKAYSFPDVKNIPVLDMNKIHTLFPIKSDFPNIPLIAPVEVSEPTKAGMVLLDEVIHQLAKCGEGSRNDALNNTAVRLGHYIAGGEFPKELAVSRLLETAKEIGLTENEAHRTIQSGLRKGMSEPQKLPMTAAEIFAQPIKPPALGGEYLPFESLTVRPTQLLNDHLADARIMITSSFERLATFEGSPHWWNGREWQIVEERMLRRYVGELIGGDQLAKASKTRIDSTMSVMLDHVPMLGRLNSPSTLVFFRNGAFNPKTGNVLPHDPINKNSRTLSVDYDPTAVAPTWQNWLSDIFSNEPERISLLQEIMGWILCRDNLGIEKAAIMIGPTRSGKGTIIHIIESLLEEAKCVFPLPQLDDKKVLASMRECNVAIDPEAASPSSKNARQIVGIFKSITANDAISIQLLYKQQTWQGPLDCKLLLAANSVPTMWDDSAATANRWIPLLFDRSFLGKEDPTLRNRLKTELQGIAAWALQGLHRLIVQGQFTMPLSSKNELTNMIQSGSPVEQFIEDCLSFGTDCRVSETSLWTAYRAWTTKTGHVEMKRTNMMKAIEDATRSKSVVRKPSIRIEGVTHRGFEGISINTVPLSANVYPFADHH